MARPVCCGKAIPTGGTVTAGGGTDGIPGPGSTLDCDVLSLSVSLSHRLLRFFSMGGMRSATQMKNGTK